MALVLDSRINLEIISEILNFRALGLLKLLGLGFSGFRIPALQDHAHENRKKNSPSKVAHDRPNFFFDNANWPKPAKTPIYVP